MAAHAANPDRDGKTLCRFIMGDLLEWSTKIDDPRVHAERAALSAAYARLASAVYAASSGRRQAFLDVYPPYDVVTRRGLDIVDTAYPHTARRALEPLVAAGVAPANDAPATPPTIEAEAEIRPVALRGRSARPGARIPERGPRSDPRLNWIDPRNGRRLG